MVSPIEARRGGEIRFSREESRLRLVCGISCRSGREGTFIERALGIVLDEAIDGVNIFLVLPVFLVFVRSPDAL